MEGGHPLALLTLYLYTSIGNTHDPCRRGRRTAYRGNGQRKMNTYLTVYFGAVLMAMCLVPVVSRLAKRYRLVDAPGPRKVHQIPIPRIGGIAFVASTLAIVLPVFFLNNNIRQDQTQFLVLLAAACFVFVLGLIDDVRPLPGSLKFVGVIGASLAICASGATIHSLSVGSWCNLRLGWAAWPLSILWITVITAGMNFIDGLDGLAAGIAAIACSTVALIAYLTDQAAMAVLMLALLGSVTGFLFFNFYPAKIFMGDCGSMFLGFIIGAGSLVCQAKTSTLVGLAVPFLVLGVPILDVSLTMIRRSTLYRRSIFASEWGHLHHRLLDLGLPQRTVAILIYAVTATSAGIGVFMLTVSVGWSVGLFAAGQVFLVAVFVCLGGTRIRETIAAAKRIGAIWRERTFDRTGFEDAQLRMREARSFDLWWEVLCDMSQQMHLQSMELWSRRGGQLASARIWYAPVIPTGRTVQLSLPLPGNATTQWEMRACIAANGHLEESGLKARFLARLLDEFPPPEPTEGADAWAGVPARSGDLHAERKERIPLVPVEGTRTLKVPAYAPRPLDITGIPVVPFETYDEALACIEETIADKQKSFWVAINPQKCYRAWHERELLEVLNRADVGICDGVGVSIASRLLNGQSIKRVTGCDLFFRLVSRAAQKGWRVFMLGASEESNALACSRLCQKYPGLQIVGRHSGFFKDAGRVIEQINASQADLLFVAMGSPTQEYWIASHRAQINAPFCMGVGGSFDVAAGTIKRAPAIFRRAGAEWLYQLVTEPHKRFKRQTVYVPFMLRVLGINAFGDVMYTEETKKPVPHPRVDV